MNRIWSIITITVFFALSACGSAATAPEPTPFDPDDPLVQDASMYAEDMGISVEEALSRFEAMDAIGELNAQLEQNEADTFAGLWIEHEPDFKVVVAFTRNGRQTVRAYTVGEPYADLIEVEAAQYTYQELRIAQERANQMLSQLGMAASSSVDVKANRVEVTVGNPDLLLADLAEAGFELPPSVVVTAIDPGNLPPSNQGDVLRYNGPGGEELLFPRQAPSAMYMEALAVGWLQFNADGCLVLATDDSELTILWRNEMSLSIEGDVINVLDGEGEVVARVGDAVELGGGEVGKAGMGETIPDINLIAACPAPYWALGDVVSAESGE